MTVNATVQAVTTEIIERSRQLRDDYLQQMADASTPVSQRSCTSCGNQAHGFAASGSDKQQLKLMQAPNIGIITAYNDMLSAHQPYAHYPEFIKAAVREEGATAQVAGATPAMCDGVTQGQAGMELSLFSRDHIAQAAAIGLSHQMFDGVLCLGICDKIVPGLLLGALRFGHLPMMFIPAGPMATGIANKQKQQMRQLFAEGKVGRQQLLESESASYHSAGTCTFYGTANSNQMMMEAMGLQLPGGSFVHPDSDLRPALTRAAAQQITRITALGDDHRPLAQVVDARAIVNAMVALLTSGGSTNHSIHLIAIARAAGYRINWSDFDRLSAVVPLLARVYPNGQADVNQFHAAGGTSTVFKLLLHAGLLHGDARTCWGDTLANYAVQPVLSAGELSWQPAEDSGDLTVISSVTKPFDSEGGLRLLQGNLGRGVIKVSAVASEHRVVQAPALVVDSQQTVEQLFNAGELDKDLVLVVRFQGPKANGMPELHKLTPFLGVLQDRGFKVALVTDGRMSGASGKVPAAIHLSPEAAGGGPLSKVHNGDMITLDSNRGTLHCHVADHELRQRPMAQPSDDSSRGVGRELFANFRRLVSSAEQGACVLFDDEPYL